VSNLRLAEVGADEAPPTARCTSHEIGGMGMSWCFVQ